MWERRVRGEAHRRTGKPCGRACREEERHSSSSQPARPIQSFPQEREQRSRATRVQRSLLFLPPRGSHAAGELGFPPSLMLHEGCNVLPQPEP